MHISVGCGLADWGLGIAPHYLAVGHIYEFPLHLFPWRFPATGRFVRLCRAILPNCFFYYSTPYCIQRSTMVMYYTFCVTD